MSPESPLRVAIVSDPLVQRGGAERVVEFLAEIFQDAPVYAVLYSAESGPASLRSRVVPSYLNRIPLAAKRHRWFFPFYPSAIESFDLSKFDVIISSHHSVGKNVLRGANQIHICYCHTPMRALWEPSLEQRSAPPFTRFLTDSILRSIRQWDFCGAARVDHFVANSGTTQRRIASHYRRESTIVFPPIDLERFALATRPREDFYLIASRLIPYKRVDIAVAATAIAGRRLVIVGGGPGIEATIGPHVDYRGHVGDGELVHLMQRARGMIFPAFEDFGMAPVEMMATGGPVIALGRGGTRETVVDGLTGVHSAYQTPEAFALAIRRFEDISFDAGIIRRHAERFSRAIFRASIERIVRESTAALG